MTVRPYAEESLGLVRRIHEELLAPVFGADRCAPIAQVTEFDERLRSVTLPPSSADASADDPDGVMVPPLPEPLGSGG